MRSAWSKYVPLSAIIGEGTQKRYTCEAVVAIWRERLGRLERAIAERDKIASDGEKSGALERLRSAKAKQEEIRLAAMERRYVDVGLLQEEFAAAAGALASTAAQLRDRFGPDAVSMYLAGVDEFSARLNGAMKRAGDDTRNGAPEPLAADDGPAEDPPVPDDG
ncbi:MAG: hypothetical protein U0575_16180 [Phycisphaerales bacterium]